MNARSAARVALGIVVSALAVLLVAQSADIPSAIARVANVDVRWLALPALVIFSQMWVRAARWAILLRAVQAVPVGTRAAMWPTTAAYLGNAVLPARLGEVVRILLISRRTRITATAATASVLIERVVDLLALLAFAAAAYGAVGAIGWLPLGAMLVLLAAFGLVLRAAGRLAVHVPVRLPARLHDVVTRLLGAFHATRPTAIGLSWLVSLLAWALDAVTVFLCAGALGISISPAAAILISAGGAVGSILPAASASFGTYELGAVAVAAIAGISADDALQVALMAHVLSVVVILVMGVGGIVLTSIGGARSAEAAGTLADAAADHGTDDRLSAVGAGER